jgi:mono/diheme cytochrome c family protein
VPAAVTLQRWTFGALLIFASTLACTRGTEQGQTDDERDSGAGLDGPAADRPPAHDGPVQKDTSSPPADAMLTPDAGTQADGPPDASSGAAFAAVQAIFDRSCARCHTTDAPPRPDQWLYPQLRLTRGASYQALVGKMASQACGGTLVTPQHPERSYIIHKLTEASPCFGKRMPHPGMLSMAPPLPPEDIAVITAWIQAGAPP